MLTKQGKTAVICLHISTCTDPLHGTIMFLDKALLETGGGAGFPYLFMYKGLQKSKHFVAFWVHSRRFWSSEK